ncbi:MAG: SurA N-terminal domain-containing protein [Granulosicoccaceae bacterium]|jgi:peptidyl-prolyl cis-trans isomerase D
MMQAIRDRAQTWLAWVIVGFISIPFALWGIQEYLGSGGPQNVAEVNGVEISVDDFRRSVEIYRQQQRERLTRLFGDADSPLIQQLLDDKLIKQQVLDAMIENRLLSLAALKAGFRVDDEQLNEIIRSIRAFQVEGVFSTEVYEQQLRYQGMSSKGFKDRLSQDEVTSQFVSGLSATAFASPREVDELLRLRFQQREASYLVLKAEDYRHQMKIDDAQIKDYYDANQAQFMTPEQVSIAYIELDAKAIADNIKPDEEMLKTYYDERADDYLVVDDREQRKLLTDLRARIEKGEDFASLAKEYSQDRGTAANGGDLGFVGRNIMEKTFEDALFALEQGEVSDIVQTSFGLHLVKVEEVRGEERHARHILVELDQDKLRRRSFEEVREQLIRDYRQQKADQLFTESYEQFNNLTYEHPDTLEVAAEELGLEIKTTEMFGREGGKGLAANPMIVQTAFNENVLGEGRNSDPLEISSDHLIVLRVNKHMPAEPRPLVEVNDIIIEKLLAEKSAEHARKLGEELNRKLQQGGDAAALAAEYQSAWQTQQAYSRDSKDLQPEILNKLFSMPRPADQPVYNSVVMPKGDYAVISLHAVKDADPQARTSAERTAAVSDLRSRDANRAVRLLKKDLRANADITIFEKNL